MEDRYFYFLLWSALWAGILNIPPGSMTITASYRLNFLHGLIASIVAAACLLGYLSEAATTTCTISYFIVDFINIIFNDFIWKGESYHTPMNRRVEYFHHFFCCFVGVASEFQYQNACSGFDGNPFVKLMFAEVSTPFLIAWRATKSDTMGALFVLAFFGNRIVYHGYYLIPECMAKCHWTSGYGFGLPYDAMNLFFLYGIVNKFISSMRKSSKEKRNK